MKDSEGNPEFCPGCPYAGDFCGEITADSTDIQLNDLGKGIVAETVHTKLLINFEDLDGIKTTKEINPDSHFTDECGIDPDDVRALKSSMDEKNAVHVILGRISRCNSPRETAKGLACKALSSKALVSIFLEK